MTYIVSSGALNSTHSLTHCVTGLELRIDVGAKVSGSDVRRTGYNKRKPGLALNELLKWLPVEKLDEKEMWERYRLNR